MAGHFHLFLKTVLFFGDKHLDDEDRKQHYAYANAAMQALITLWNCLNEEMPERAPGLPPKDAVRNIKAKRVGISARAYRLAFKNAYGVSAFKPYTHITRHLEAHQLRVQYDLSRYSGQAQEHYGKIQKSIVKTQTNFAMGSKKKNGEFNKSYVQQGAEVMLHRKSLNQEVPVRGTDYSVGKKQIEQWTQTRKQQRRQRTVLDQKCSKRDAKLERKASTFKQRKLVTKHDEWVPHHAAMSKTKK